MICVSGIIKTVMVCVPGIIKTAKSLHMQWGQWGRGGVAPLVLNFGIRCGWVVRLMPPPLYPRRKSPFATEYGDEIKEGVLDWHVACMGEKRDACMAKATIAGGKRPLGIPKRRLDASMILMWILEK